jgi:hypothetical protein
VAAGVGVCAGVESAEAGIVGGAVGAATSSALAGVGFAVTGGALARAEA